MANLLFSVMGPAERPMNLDPCPAHHARSSQSPYLSTVLERLTWTQLLAGLRRAA
ncbi:hypothetical protein [Nocardia niwae]|uniref:hypothetical protein n=1 Tax=Nocardia niwae TaxID=626084 RepID=UPI0033FC544E